MNKKIAATVLCLTLFATGLTGCSSWSRDVKSIKSDLTGGLNRTVSVYAQDGTLIKSWTGKFDVSESTDETFFDIDGKRVIIQGGIIINEEN